MTDDEQQRVPYLIPPPPEEVIRDETSRTKNTGGGTERVQETPERIAARESIADLGDAASAALEQKKEHDVAAADLDEQYKGEQVRLFEEQQAAREKALHDTQPIIDEWRTRLRDSMAKYDAAPAPKLFADRTTGQKIVGAIGIALAGLSDAIGNAAMVRVGQAPKFNVVDQLIESDLNRQREAIKRLDDRVVSAKTGLADAQQARAQLLAEVDQRGAVAFKRAELVAARRLSALGKSQAEVQAGLDALGWQQKVVELTQQSVAPLVDHVNETFSNGIQQSHSRTQNVNKPAPSTQIPTHITDLLTGKDLPVDPTATDGRQHNTAVGKLGPINTFIDTSNKLIDAADQEGPARASIIGKVLGGGEKQADREAAVVRLRSAYAAAKGESIGAENMKHLEEAVPSPPSNLAPKGAWEVWRTKMKAVNEEMRQLRQENLAAAGVPRTAIGTPERREAPKSELPAKSTGNVPAAPATPASRRDKVIQELRKNPNSPRADFARRLFKITDEELRP